MTLSLLLIIYLILINFILITYSSLRTLIYTTIREYILDERNSIVFLYNFIFLFNYLEVI